MATIYKRVVTDPKTGKQVESRTWWVSYQENGRQVQRSLKVTNKTLAEMQKVDIERNIERGLVGLPLQNVDALQVIQDYRDAVIANRSPSWAKRLEQAFGHWARFVESRGLTNLNRITTRDIEQHMMERNAVLAAKTANEELRVIKNFFNFAVQRAYIVQSPAMAVEKRHAEKPAVEILTPKELALIMKYAPKQLLPFIRLLLFTGLRDGEGRFLQWRDVDLTPGREQIMVRSTPDHRTKTRRDRIVPLNKEAIEVLSDLQRKRRPESDYVFPNRDGRPKVHLRNTWVDLLQRIRRKEGVVIDKGSHMTGFHLLRHTFATNCLASGLDIRTVQDLLGHANVTQTQRYVNLLPEHKYRQIDKLKIQIGDDDQLD